jgi:hypothetical protein
MERRLEKELRLVERRITGRNFQQLGSFFPPILMAGVLTLFNLSSYVYLAVLVGGWILTSLVARLVTERLLPPVEAIHRQMQQSNLISRFASGQTAEHSIIEYCPLLLRSLIELELFLCGNPKGLAREACLVALNLDWYCATPRMIARWHWILQFLSLPAAFLLVLLSHMLYPMSQFAFACVLLICTVCAYCFVSFPFAARQTFWTVFFITALREGLIATEQQNGGENEDLTDGSGQAPADNPGPAGDVSLPGREDSDEASI